MLENIMLDNLGIKEDKLIHMFSISSIIKNTSNVKYKYYVHDKLKKLTNEDLSYIEGILDYFKLKSLENQKLRNHLHHLKNLLLKEKD